MCYQVPQHIDNDKIFIINRSEIEDRLEPEFYRPSIATLEKHIRSLATRRLRDYATYMAGGATPKKTEADKYYSDSESGIPFLRVQNLQTTGELSLGDCVYINKDTHNGLLQRSRVAEGDLLVKITGVGRMAIASVAPKGFVGNTNQHMVVIKTEDAAVSNYLARYLNLDIIERIASRHSTGGTRPALDYPSLKNIPVIEGIDFSIIDEAISIKKQKEQRSEAVLNSIDDYLLDELGIKSPEIKTDLKSRQFFINRSALEGRFDPSVYKDGIKLVSGKYENVKLSSCAWVNPNTSFRGMDADTLISFIPMEVIDECYCEVTSLLKKPIADSSGFTKFQNDDLLWAKITPCMQNGKSVVARGLTNGLGCGSTEFFVIRPRTNQLYIDYLQALLHMKAIRRTAMLYFGGSAGQQRVSINFIENFNVPLPPKKKQEEIVAHISEMRARAKKLQAEGAEVLQKAKMEVERMILG